MLLLQSYFSFRNYAFVYVGYDPGQINPYVSKILCNGCLLDYELQEVEEKKFYQITGIRSVHGEVLKFVKVSGLGQSHSLHQCSNFYYIAYTSLKVWIHFLAQEVILFEVNFQAWF